MRVQSIGGNLREDWEKKVFSSLSDAVTKKRAYFVSTEKNISLAAAIYRRNCRFKMAFL